MKTKEEFLVEIEKLKRKYKKKKEELEFADNDVDEGFVREVLDRYKRQIKKLKEEMENLTQSQTQVS